ncbi:PREDICTED: leishmanolysin-like peptidase [Amphimedon queenslandica]|uniref:Leishmanolysin-like peptidase n=4 Tax=Amphimedon queenslandica TaxID=400682 RepID=A0AAN0IPI7_AMPQE|nr:PREDICTED: leishmanolysin-like peptidase [Amphimedon queenslandica]|eukprot:XP_011406415.2 PREDICTED: leishmanolysin-like peptidase [Amphimedon queenslandica]
MAGVSIRFLLIVGLVSYCAASEEIIEDKGDIIHGVYLEPFSSLILRDSDQSLRLSIYYDDSITNGIPSSVRDRIQNSIVPKLKTFFESLLMVRPTQAPILLQRSCTGGSYYPTNINNTIRCAYTCQSSTTCGQTTVPSDHLKACIQCNGNSNTCTKTGSDGSGISNADMILYVSAVVAGSCGGGSGSTSTIAFATTCQMESALDRPIAGSVNFCPSAITDKVTDDFIIATAKHEIIHALAFSPSLYPFWRDQNGKPRTDRDSNGYPPRGSGYYNYMWSDSTIKQVTYNDWQVYKGSVSHTVNLVVTPTVVAEAARYFDCSSLVGVELENQGGQGTQLSHWEKRILGNEVMTGIIDSNPTLSNITLALLEDSGWYKVNYVYGEYLAWGYKKGCSLATKSCYQYMNERSKSGESLTPFCNQFSSSNQGLRYGCTADREYKAECNLAKYTTSLPQEYQYFSDPTVGGGNQVGDFCPYQNSFSYTSGRDTQCSNPSNQPPDNQDIAAETYGPGSKCFNHANQWTLGTNIGPLMDSGCYKCSCNGDWSSLTVYVKGTAYTCNKPGQTFNISAPSNGFGQYNGMMACPSSFETVCQESN